MKPRIAMVALLAALPALVLTPQAYAKGCLKGAAVGGVAGHVAGHHAIAGAAIGCAVGHHQAAKKDKAAAAQRASDASKPE
ncbi:hypothetical protein [Burkholderia plantarii]|uniref:hypothetical protein n=1 Tax=Burkholderia plantarii TaxID=41899 RepID=UPI000705B097|nr:hypothetical protein [Burkholderia plantarii]ALK34357.1 glycine zipper 2TM domain protein [Burkholderia plantarii]GLZ22146.1 hypothetical protein Bpla01_56750 [Burkholderia plantarii]